MAGRTGHRFIFVAIILFPTFSLTFFVSHIGTNFLFTNDRIFIKIFLFSTSHFFSIYYEATTAVAAIVFLFFFAFQKPLKSSGLFRCSLWSRGGVGSFLEDVQYTYIVVATSGDAWQYNEPAPHYS